MKSYVRSRSRSCFIYFTQANAHVCFWPLLRHQTFECECPHRTREDGNVTFLNVCTRERGVFCRLPCVKIPLFITCRLGRHSHVTPCNICDCRKDSNEGFRTSKSALVVPNWKKNLLSLQCCSGDSQPRALRVHLQGTHEII